MISNPISAPPPDLRIVMVADVLPHEKTDFQRSQPLVERLRDAARFTNPPLVTAISAHKYVLMDGSNRHVSMRTLGFKHILVQVADYDSDFVELSVWQHIVSDWESRQFFRRLRQIERIDIRSGWNDDALAQVLLRNGPVWSIHAGVDSLIERNSILRQVVEVYHENATLNRTPLTDPGQIWTLFPSGFALVMFPVYQPQDIIDAAVESAFLPPGISRHIIHGRALNLNYPMSYLRADRPLADKNQQLREWLRRQYVERSVRYYAESTYQFDE